MLHPSLSFYEVIAASFDSTWPEILDQSLEEFEYEVMEMKDDGHDLPPTRANIVSSELVIIQPLDLWDAAWTDRKIPDGRRSEGGPSNYLLSVKLSVILPLTRNPYRP